MKTTAALALLATLALSACASLEPAATAARAQAARAADDSMALALYAICYPQSTGAWNREFSTDKERAEAWRVLCGFKATPTVRSVP